MYEQYFNGLPCHSFPTHHSKSIVSSFISHCHRHATIVCFLHTRLVFLRHYHIQKAKAESVKLLIELHCCVGYLNLLLFSSPPSVSYPCFRCPSILAMHDACLPPVGINILSYPCFLIRTSATPFMLTSSKIVPLLVALLSILALVPPSLLLHRFVLSALSFAEDSNKQLHLTDFLLRTSLRSLTPLRLTLLTRHGLGS